MDSADGHRLILYEATVWDKSDAAVVIEPDMPGVAVLEVMNSRGASQTSCSVLRNLGSEVQSVRSYVADEKICFICRAPREDPIRQDAQSAGFPANKICEVRAMIDATTAE